MPPSAAAFPRRNRLLTGAEFGAVFRRRRSVHGKHFSVHVAANDLGHPRLGLAVSRRVSAKAVVRNRIKRRIRESFRLQQHFLGALDYVVVAKPPAANGSGEEIRRELDRLWARATQKGQRK